MDREKIRLKKGFSKCLSAALCIVISIWMISASGVRAQSQWSPYSNTGWNSQPFFNQITGYTGSFDNRFSIPYASYSLPGLYNFQGLRYANQYNGTGYAPFSTVTNFSSTLNPYIRLLSPGSWNISYPWQNVTFFPPTYYSSAPSVVNVTANTGWPIINYNWNLPYNYSINIPNPYSASAYRSWYPPGVSSFVFSPSLMISVPRRPNTEPSSATGSLFPNTLKLPKQLTFSGKDATPFWSPDGNHIAFLSLRNTYNPDFSAMQFELWVMEKDGSNQRPILSVDDLDEGSKFLDSKVSWAKNSNELLVSVYNSNTSEIWSISLDGNISRLSSVDDWTGYPLYSFDGAKIAFVVQEPDPIQGPGGRLYISNSDYSEHILIDEGIIFDFTWKSDSQGLIYSNSCDLWEYSISKNEKTQLSATPENEENPSCSSDGKYIAFSVRNALFQDAVYITPANTFQPKKLIDGARLPRWIPNRNLLVIASEQTLNNESFWTESWIIDLEGNILRKIAEGTCTELDFAPDGKHFVYSLYGNLWLDHIP